MEVQELMDLTNLTTFRMAPVARYFGVVRSLEDLQAGFEFAEAWQVPVFILGGGSNIIFGRTEVFEALVLKMELTGVEVISEDAESVVLKVFAGEIWDNVVKQAVVNGWWGIEAMSWIPGTAGATPIQNVGAYGREIADVLVSLEAFEIATGHQKVFTKDGCKFSYRDSAFKHELKGQYVITAVTLRLSKRPGTVPDYPGVKQYFAERGVEHPTLAEIRDAIIAIRSTKLPDPSVIASVGSFFKNPIISEAEYEELAKKFPEVVAFRVDGGFKIAAGWLLQALGYKGKQFGQLKFYEHNTLVLTNLGQTTPAELDALVRDVKADVHKTFGITLESEPLMIR